MKTEDFKRIYSESRNGANHFVRHWAARSFQFSDGVSDLANCGLHWFLDIAATELPKLIPIGDMGELHLVVKGHSGNAYLSMDDDAPHAWSRSDILTDCPEGDWMFFLVNEGERIAMILPSEY